MALIADALAQTWLMGVASLGFLGAVAVLVLALPLPRPKVTLPARVVFAVALVLGFALLAVCLTLIDKPHFAWTPVTKEWLFMFAAFLGVPLTVPLVAVAAWALPAALRQGQVSVTPLALTSLGAFALGCAASNIHDVVFCAAITGGYVNPHKAGYDLDIFVAFGQRFGIPAEVLGDYATLGPFAMVLVLGELLVAAAVYARLRRAAGR